MNVFTKYANGLDNDPSRISALRAFSAVINGRIGRMTYKMVTDQQMRDLLDDDDYAFWVESKSKNAVTFEGIQYGR